jgi:uncharacterized membrane protein
MTKKYFLTGLVILLPLALTLAIIIFIFNFLTDPFAGVVQSILKYFNLLDWGFLFLTPYQLQILVSKLIILGLLFLFTLTLGALGRWFFGHYLIKLWDRILHRIPIVSSIYKTCQDVISTIFTSQSNSFKQVVMVPFPKEETWSVGFVTRDHLPGLPHSSKKNMLAVFVPTTPNPTSGFLVVYDEDDVVYLDMTVEAAFKFVISCGVIAPPFKSITKREAHKISKQNHLESPTVEET